MRFFLGISNPAWLARVPHPLFVSRRSLAKRRSLPRAVGIWALDSGGFSELSLFGRWTITPAQYVSEVRRFDQEIGGLEWAAVMDWMCEPWMLQKTGLSVREHQRRTIQSYLDLLTCAPTLPWVPVLQGWQHDDYLRHVEQYDRSGVDLRKLPLVGLGSVCRRQHTAGVEALVRRLSREGIRLHGFGVKTQGLLRAGDVLTSADSMAWSFTAWRERILLPGHNGRHRCCNNCIEYALLWRANLLKRLKSHRSTERQEMLPLTPR